MHCLSKLVSLLLILTLLSVPALAEERPFQVVTSEPSSTNATITDLRLPELRLVQFDVGFANAYMLVLGEDVFLIDCGNAMQDRNHQDLMMSYLENAGIQRITGHFVTHFHDDHSGNMNVINETYADEETIIFTPAGVIPPKYPPLKTGKLVAFTDGEEVRYGDMTIKCVGPARVSSKGYVNKDSMNLLITYGSRRILLTGDAVDTATVVYGHAEELADVDVMQFPHHGLKPYTISETALAIINPTYVLVPGASAFKLKDYFYGNGKRPQMDPIIYSIGDGTFMITTDGTSLDFFTHLTPEEYRVTQVSV